MTGAVAKSRPNGKTSWRETPVRRNYFMSFYGSANISQVGIKSFFRLLEKPNDTP